MGRIEQYEEEGKGYHPFLIRKGWQVALLNYAPEEALEAIDRLDAHHETDEVFVLLSGEAVLIAAEKREDRLLFETVAMAEGKVYNIPVHRWHKIAMRPGCRVLIVEDSHTHENDFEFLPLTEAQRQELRERVLHTLQYPSHG